MTAAKPRSLQARLAISLGGLLGLIWLATASVTTFVLRAEMDEVFDSALQETAERLLPLVIVDVMAREADDAPQRLTAIRAQDEFFTYLVRDAQGRVLMQSHTADPADFPPPTLPAKGDQTAPQPVGFSQNLTHRFYTASALRNHVNITVAEPLAHRADVAREILIGLGLPLLVVIPVAVLAIVIALRASLASLRAFRANLAARSANDLSPVPDAGLPLELAPVAGTLNALLLQLKNMLVAERSFSANAAHELRTPLAGAIAQAQRLQAETHDPAARARAAEIEITLKRMTRLSERLLQLARAEGGRLRGDQAHDLRGVARIVVEDLGRNEAAGRIRLTLPQAPVMSDLDPDAMGILLRNLVENAQRHGDPQAEIAVSLAENGALRVANDGPIVPPESLAKLTQRFERAQSRGEGSGLGLAIVALIADRIGSELILASPRAPDGSAPNAPNSGVAGDLAATGFEVRLRLPIQT